MVFFSGLLVSPLPAGEEPSAKPEPLPRETAPDPNAPIIEVFDFGWSDKGEIVLGVRITAPKSRGISLGRDAQDESMEIFSTRDSYLVDLNTREKIPALKKYPRVPGFGWIRTATVLAPGEFMNFTAAFPRPADPPMKDQKHGDYLLRLQLPGRLEAVDFKIPYGAPGAKQ